MSATKDETKPTQRFSWKKAGNLLTDTEKNRICCLLMTCFEQIKPTSEDFELAAAQLGATKGGFTKMYQTSVKKLKEAEAYIIEGENVDDIPGPTVTPPKTPKKAPAKRKAVASEDVNGEGGGEKTPAKKPKAVPKKRAAAKVETKEEEKLEISDETASTPPADVEKGEEVVKA